MFDRHSESTKQPSWQKVFYWWWGWMCIPSSSSKRWPSSRSLLWFGWWALPTLLRIKLYRYSYFRTAQVKCPSSKQLSSSSHWLGSRMTWRFWVWKCSRDWPTEPFTVFCFQATCLGAGAYSCRIRWNDFVPSEPRITSRKTSPFDSSSLSCSTGLVPSERGSCCSAILISIGPTQSVEC